MRTTAYNGVLRCTAAYNGVLRRTTAYYGVPRRITAYYGIPRRIMAYHGVPRCTSVPRPTSAYYGILRHTKGGKIAIKLKKLEEHRFPKRIPRIKSSSLKPLTFSPGFGIFVRKTTAKFKDNVISYLRGIHERSENYTKFSQNFEKAAQDMRRELDENEEFRFTKEECLLSSQIKSLFSRFSRQQKQGPKTSKSKSTNEDSSQPLTEEEIISVDKITLENDHAILLENIQENLENDEIVYEHPLQVS